MRYARIINGIVFNIELWDVDNVPIGLIATDIAGPGWTYNNSTHVFSPPAIPTPEPGSPEATAATLLLIQTVDDFSTKRMATGFADQVTGKTWQCDLGSIGKWTALAASAGFAIVLNTDPAPTFDIIAGDNTVTTFTAQDTFALLQQRVMPWVSATIFFARQMKNAILAGNPPQDITVGWP